MQYPSQSNIERHLNGFVVPTMPVNATASSTCVDTLPGVDLLYEATPALRRAFSRRTLLNCLQTLDARDALAPRFDGMGRWLMRLFGIRDMGRTTPVNPSQPCRVKA